MLKDMRSEVWAFDLEWVPDVESGRRAYSLPSAVDDETVLEELWQRGGATDEDPHPSLTTVLCRVVFPAMVDQSVRTCILSYGSALPIRRTPRPAIGVRRSSGLVFLRWEIHVRRGRGSATR